MAIPIKINGVEVTFPVDVRELTNKQFFGLFECKNIIEELSVVTGISKEQFDNFKNLKSIEFAQTLMRTLAGSIAAGFDGSKRPDVFVIDGKEIKVPTELRLEPIGAFMSVHDIIKGHINDEVNRGVQPVDINYTKLIPRIVAHYFYLPFNGNDVLYSEEKAEHDNFMSKIMNCNFVASTQIANFFFRNANALT